MAKSNKIYKIFLLAVVFAIVGLILTMGIIAINKSMKLKIEYEVGESWFLISVELKDANDADYTTIFQNNGESLIVHSGIETSQDGAICLYFNQDYVDTLTAPISIKFTNYCAGKVLVELNSATITDMSVLLEPENMLFAGSSTQAVLLNDANDLHIEMSMVVPVTLDIADFKAGVDFQIRNAYIYDNVGISMGDFESFSTIGFPDVQGYDYRIISAYVKIHKPFEITYSFKQDITPTEDTDVGFMAEATLIDLMEEYSFHRSLKNGYGYYTTQMKTFDITLGYSVADLYVAYQIPGLLMITFTPVMTLHESPSVAANVDTQDESLMVGLSVSTTSTNSPLGVL